MYPLLTILGARNTTAGTGTTNTGTNDTGTDRWEFLGEIDLFVWHSAVVWLSNIAPVFSAHITQTRFLSPA